MFEQANLVRMRDAVLGACALLLAAGCSSDSTGSGTTPQTVRQIDDINYVHGKYFFLQLPSEQLATDSRIDFSTLHIFVDDRNGSNDQGARAGSAEVDPTLAPGVSARLVGAFDGLRELTDYEVTLQYFGERFPVLVLKTPISAGEILAVAYRENLSGGGARDVGSVPDCPAGGAPCDSLRLKIIQAPSDVLFAMAGNTDYYETDPVLAPFNVTREYTCKNFYDLQTTNIDPRHMVVEVRRYDRNLDEPIAAYKEGTALFPYLQILGVDVFKDNGAGAPMAGPDSVVDQFTNATFIDLERGVLYFPDLRPFDPRLPGRPDTRTEDEYFFHSRVPATDPAIPGLRGRVFWPAGMAGPPGVVGSPTTPVALETNPRVYDKRNLESSSDRRYYIHFAFTPNPPIAFGPVAP